MYVYSYSYTYGIKSPQLKEIANNAAYPMWSNDGQFLAYIDFSIPLDKKIVIVETVSEELIESKSIGSVTVTDLVWSPNDNFLAYSTTDGNIFIYDIWGTNQADPTNDISQISNLQLGNSHEITAIDWETSTNKVYYYSPGLGVASIYASGLGYSLIYNPVTMGTVGRDMVSIDILGSLYYTANDGKAYVYNTQAQSEHAFDAMNNVQSGPIASLRKNRSNDMWNSYYDYYYGVIESNVAHIKTPDADAGGNTPQTVYTSSSSSPITDIDILPVGDESMLYSPSVETYSFSTLTPDFSYDIDFNANNILTGGANVTLTPLAINKKTGEVVTGNDIVIPSAEYSIYGHAYKTASLSLPNAGDYWLSCHINVSDDPYMQQSCPQVYSVYYYVPLEDVRRFWSNRYMGHFYTSDYNEAQYVIDTWPDIWGYEQVAFRVKPRDTANGCPKDSSPVYRFWSDRYMGHFYTIDPVEKGRVIATWPDVWKYEGERYCASTAPTTDLSVPLYRFWSDKYMGHFYTASSEEKNRVIATWPDVWKYEGIAYYVAP